MSEHTGHTLRLSLTKLLVDGRVEDTCLKRHGGWKWTTVAEGIIEDTLRNKTNIALKILSPRESDVFDTTKNIPTVRVQFEIRNTEVCVISGFNFRNAAMHNCTININVVNTFSLGIGNDYFC